MIAAPAVRPFRLPAPVTVTVIRLPPPTELPMLAVLLVLTELPSPPISAPLAPRAKLWMESAPFSLAAVARTRSAPASMVTLPRVPPVGESSAALMMVLIDTSLSETPIASAPAETPSMLVLIFGWKVAVTSTAPAVRIVARPPI